MAIPAHHFKSGLCHDLGGQSPPFTVKMCIQSQACPH